MMTTTNTSAEQLQRDPDPSIPYRLLARLSDRWAGWRDRDVIAVSDHEARSPWLAALAHECATRLEAERRTTRVAIALLEQRLVQERQALASAAATLQEQLDHIQRRSDEELSSEATNAAERTDEVAVRLARRRRERAAALGSLEAHCAELRSRRDAASVSIEQLEAACRSHQTVLAIRCSHLLAHYSRRAATYVREATRRSGTFALASALPTPSWLPQPISE